ARRRRLMDMLASYHDAAAVHPDAAVVLDRRDHAIIWSNLAAERLLGLSHPADNGKRLHNLLRAPRLQAWLEQRGSEPLTDLPSPVDASVQLGLRMLPFGEGRLLLVGRDMTRLTRLEQVRRDFVANVSHELRTPLTVIHGYLEMMDPAEHVDWGPRSEEHTSELQSRENLVCRLLLEKKKTN